jgi:hypothetical protein
MRSGDTEATFWQEGGHTTQLDGSNGVILHMMRVGVRRQKQGHDVDEGYEAGGEE